MLPSIKHLGSVAVFVLSTIAFARAICPVDEVHVQGRVDHPPANARVRIVLVYGDHTMGESSEVTLQGEKFRLSVDFLTQSRRPIVNGSFEKCRRRPTRVVVSLLDTSRMREYDRAVFDFSRDFTQIDRTAYALKQDILLTGPQ